MAQIDELIAAMMERRADALILQSDQPAQLNFGGKLASGALVPAPLLRAMLREIVPALQINRLHYEGVFEFSYACNSGLMDVQVERHGLDFYVNIAPHSSTNIFIPPKTPAPTFQTYKPPVDSSFAPPPSPPNYNAAPIPGYSVPMVTSQNTPSAYTSQAPLAPAKESVHGWTVFFNVIVFWILASLFLPISLLPPLAAFFFLHHLFLLPLLAAIIAAFGILIDARVLGVRRGLVRGLGDIDAQGWFFTTLALGILGIPLYLAARPAYKRALQKHLLKP